MPVVCGGAAAAPCGRLPPCAEPLAHAIAYSAATHGNVDGRADGDPGTHGDADCNADRHAHCDADPGAADTHRDADPNRHADAAPHGNGNGDGNGDPDCNADAAPHGNAPPTHRNADPGAATATPTPAPAGWHAEYYARPDLSGAPVLVRTDADVGFDWGRDAPAPGVPADGFSVRWTRTAPFEEGTYLFHAAMDDGMRVYVDDELLIDEWLDRSAREVLARRAMSAGEHAVRVEYYDRKDLALADLWWEKERAYADWKGVYWANQRLLGAPVLLRNDVAPGGGPGLDFNWGMSSPGGAVPDDHFSARWTRTMAFEDGQYRFAVLSDDGVRLWVDEQLVFDAWTDHAQNERTVDYAIAGTGAHELRVEYYDNTFDARLRVSWTRIGEAVYPDWRGEYYANPDLAGAPLLIRNDAAPDFDWAQDAPAPGVPADGFSVRWTRTRQIEPGHYRFYFHVDDGVRFHVDDKLVLNEWHQSWDQTYQADVELSWKPKLVIEMYEGTGDARIKVWWEKR